MKGWRDVRMERWKEHRQSLPPSKREAREKSERKKRRQLLLP